jgi:hypothetical protein
LWHHLIIPISHTWSKTYSLDFSFIWVNKFFGLTVRARFQKNLFWCLQHLTSIGPKSKWVLDKLQLSKWRRQWITVASLAIGSTQPVFLASLQISPSVGFLGFAWCWFYDSVLSCKFTLPFSGISV